MTTENAKIKAKMRTTELAANALVVVGLSAMTYGLSMIYTPAAWLFVGLSMTTVGVGLIASTMPRTNTTTTATKQPNVMRRSR